MSVYAIYFILRLQIFNLNLYSMLLGWTSPLNYHNYFSFDVYSSFKFPLVWESADIL